MYKWHLHSAKRCTKQSNKQLLLLLHYFIPSLCFSRYSARYHLHAKRQEQVPQVYMQETSPSPAARWSIKSLLGSSWDATYPPGWSLFVSSHCLPCSMPAAMAQQPLLLASYQPHCSQPHRAGGARQPTGGSWLVQRKAGNLSEEGSVNVGWGISAVPSQEESKQSSCFEWGIKERCWSSCEVACAKWSRGRAGCRLWQLRRLHKEPLFPCIAPCPQGCRVTVWIFSFLSLFACFLFQSPGLNTFDQMSVCGTQLYIDFQTAVACPLNHKWMFHVFGLPVIRGSLIGCINMQINIEQTQISLWTIYQKAKRLHSQNPCKE